MDIGTVDEGMYWVSQGLLLADWGQTREIASNDDFSEFNPLLGRTPSLTEVNLWFGGALLANYGINSVDCDKSKCKQLKRAYLTGVIIMQAANVINNKSIGIGFKF